ncbi:hypothetical protein ISF_02028 [Cordyceps fumosorosea ARSEF 2679]|uniref:Uncharacterized protein n=1 Tax=Cordyceps fumosorosea (strain ARSEF 2679) TaxID=1081104 RepID=A0A168CK65_CORFA|nr:hypothetical protein ISF_02028 [Cordyceps fumosorosea ARSEF 2679]OAA71477.1 hypothetical protein ISF_02028 [Cordyceps fumosorosea ARSEF 2679]
MTMLDNTFARSEGGISDGLNMLERRGTAALGLGWLIAIILCGGVSLFIVVGFALAWRAQKRRGPLTITRTTASLPYEASGITAILRQRASTTKLTRRRMKIVRERSCLSDLNDDDGTMLGRFSAIRIPSLPVLPSLPSLPMLPSYGSLRRYHTSRRSYRRDKAWLDDEEAIEIGRVVAATYKPRPGSGSGWAGQKNPPALQPVGHKAMMQGVGVIGQEQNQRQQRLPDYQQHYQQQRQQQQQQNSTQQWPSNNHYANLYDQDEKSRHVEEEQSMPKKPSAVYSGDGAAAAPAKGGFTRPAGAVLARHPTCTDSDLRTILRSTEQRLRDGDRNRSRSPEKIATPQDSPTKTPRSVRSQQQHHQPHSGSPTRIPGSASGGMGARDGSATSISSAANSLIAHATEELELPGGMGSPSRLRGREWLPGDDAILQLTTPGLQQEDDEVEAAYIAHRDSAQSEYQKKIQQYQQQLQLYQQQQQQQQQYANSQRSPQRSPQREREQRRRSVDSDASSSLSTLYSVGDEVDDASIQAVVEGPDDAFVERNGVSELAPLRRTMTVSSDTLARHIDHDTMPPLYCIPPRKQSLSQQKQHSYHRMHKSLDGPRFAGALQPPLRDRAEEIVRPKSATMASPQLSLSESSYTDMSVDSTTMSLSSDGTITGETGETEVEALEMVEEMTTPVKHDRRRDSDVSSSPFSEADIVNMIIAAQSPKRQTTTKRALPVPPILMPPADGSITPTPLSPPPKSVARTASMRNAAVARQLSVTSSYYSNNDGNGNKNTSNNNNSINRNNGSVSRGPLANLSVATSVAELRRMNSLISIASNHSLTSITAAASVESMVEPLRTGLSDTTHLHGPRMGNRQYLNVGSPSRLDAVGGVRKTVVRPGGPRPKKSGPARSNTTTAAAAAPERPAKNPRRSLGNVRAPPALLASPEKESQDSGKENAGLGISHVQERRYEPYVPPVKSMRNPMVAELVAAAERRGDGKRGSVDSLGLYDKDGFLLPSPEREMHKKLLRM